jgi:hypothetical protein
MGGCLLALSQGGLNESTWSVMKLRDFPGFLDAWPGQPHESDSQGSPALDDAAESLIDCFLQPKKETTGAVIVILTACRGEECSRNL